MYLRCKRRFRDRKEYRDWNNVEAEHCAEGQDVQRLVLYLGEINDHQRERWCRVIEAFDEDLRQHTQLALFPVHREVPAHTQDYNVHVPPAAMQLHRLRQ